MSMTYVSYLGIELGVCDTDLLSLNVGPVAEDVYNCPLKLLLFFSVYLLVRLGVALHITDIIKL